MPINTTNTTNGFHSSTKAGNSEASSLIDSVRENLPSQGSDGSFDREKLKRLAFELSIALETPGDTVQRIAYYPIQTTVVRIANRLDIFNTLVRNNGPMSGTELAKILGVDHKLLIRLMRYLVANLTVGEAGVDSYVATSITKNLTIAELAAGVNYLCDTVTPIMMALPNFLERTDYQNPGDPKHSATQDAIGTTDTYFEYLPKHPQKLKDFNMWMTGQREGRVSWLDFFPFDEQLANGFRSGDDAVMFVDVGGGVGHEVKAVKNKYPNLGGRFILQDLPETIEQATLVPGMEAVEHDFFAPQPIKGARVYYLRNVLHDWPDNKSQMILSQIAAAMTPGYSMIILNELVIPDQGANLISAQRDICMMTLFGAVERTERQWRAMVDSAGLKIEQIWTHTQGAESIIKVVLK